MKKTGVSVLVPIYNVDEFLPKCLDSLVGQTLKNIEIICINDGSTDDSLEIVKEYAKRDKRIKIIDKANSGYGDSMNRGLAEATGEYIGVVEPDDFIDTNAFESMYNIAIENDVEVVKANFYEYCGSTEKDRRKSDLFLPKDIGKVVDPRKRRDIFYQPPCIWAAIYKADFLRKNEIDFLPTSGAAYQDTGFNFKVWAMARKAYFIDRAFLHYRQDNSGSSVKSDGKIYCVKDEYDAIEKYLNERGLISELGGVLSVCRFGGYVWNLNRLKFGSAMKFAGTVKTDYKRIKNAGFLDDDALSKKKYVVWLLIVHYPRIYVLMKPFYWVYKKMLSLNKRKEK